MIDIETLGTKPGSVILSIGAVCFNLDTGENGSIFHTDISGEDCIKRGLEIDYSTFRWWMEQDKEAQNKLLKNQSNKTLKIGLLSLGRFISDNCPPNVQVWGNSARFDLGILQKAYDAVGLELPWNHYRERDVRTLVMFNPLIKKQMTFTGIKHYPIDDCRHQIKYCSAIKQTIKTFN